MAQLDDLIDLTGMKKTAFADEANISIGYLHKIIKGKRISRAYAQRIVMTLNRHIPDAQYTVDSLGLNLSD